MKEYTLSQIHKVEWRTTVTANSFEEAKEKAQDVCHKWKEFEHIQAQDITLVEIKKLK